MKSDGLACSIMVALCENYLPAFALALGMSQVAAGLIPGVPLLAGAVLQLAAPLAIRRIGSHRRWVLLSVTLQALSLLPLLATALVGHIWTPLFFLLAAIYWGAGMASGPAWNAWVETLIPPRLRVRFFGRFTRMAQSGLLMGYVGGGLILALGQYLGRPLWAFAALYFVAAASRMASCRFLASQTEPVPPRELPGSRVADMIHRLRHGSDGRILVFLWMTQFAAQIASPFFTPFMLGHLHFSYLRFMLVMSVPLAVKAVALPTLSRLVERIGARRFLRFCAVAIIPLPLFWIVSQSTGYLMSLQVVSGLCWGSLELGSLLIVFEVIDRRQRVGMLTIHSLGNSVAIVGGSLCGAAMLGLLGAGPMGYYTVFAVSSSARLLSVLALWRLCNPAVGEEEAEPTIVEFPAIAEPPAVEELAA